MLLDSAIGIGHHLLGKYGSKSSREKYQRLVAEYKASRKSKAFGKSELLLQDVMLAFVRHVNEYYRGSDLPYRFKLSMRPVAELYATLPAKDFGPKQFRAVLEHWLSDTTRSRNYINDHMRRVIAMVQWAVAEELVQPDQLVKIRAVKLLERGRCTAREPEPVTSVPTELLEATLPCLTQVVSDMIRFQLLTGCRPGELVRICPGMVDRSGEVWTIELSKHKTAHKGKRRTIYVGPKAQAVLAPYLLRGADDPCFSPIESEKQRRQARHEARKTPLGYGNGPGSNVARKPRTQPGEAYTTGTYCRAIRYACIRGKLQVWSPNMLRHSCATELRKQHGLEAAQVILGHSELSVTQVYAETNTARAIEVAKLSG